MKKDPKKMAFTSHTLWTAPSNKEEGQKYDPVTTDLKEKFKKSLAAAEGELKKKLESFDSVEISDSSTRALVK